MVLLETKSQSLEYWAADRLYAFKQTTTSDFALRNSNFWVAPSLFLGSSLMSNKPEKVGLVICGIPAH